MGAPKADGVPPSHHYFRTTGFGVNPFQKKIVGFFLFTHNGKRLQIAKKNTSLDDAISSVTQSYRNGGVPTQKPEEKLLNSEYNSNF